MVITIRKEMPQAEFGLRHLNTLIIYMMLSCYLMNSSSRYFGSGQSESSTINSNLSIW